MNPTLDRLLRQHEAGDTVSYSKLGTLIFRQIDGQSDIFNRVDKISVHNGSAEVDSTYRAFGAPDEIPRRKKRVTESMQLENELRNATGVYQQTKGGPRRPEHYGSNLFNVLNQEESKRTGGDRIWTATARRKNVKFQSSDFGLFQHDPTPTPSEFSHHRRNYSETRSAGMSPSCRSNQDVMSDKGSQNYYNF